MDWQWTDRYTSWVNHPGFEHIESCLMWVNHPRHQKIPGLIQSQRLNAESLIKHIALHNESDSSLINHRGFWMCIKELLLNTFDFFDLLVTWRHALLFFLFLVLDSQPFQHGMQQNVSQRSGFIQISQEAQGSQSGFNLLWTVFLWKGRALQEEFPFRCRSTNPRLLVLMDCSRLSNHHYKLWKSPWANTIITIPLLL